MMNEDNQQNWAALLQKLKPRDQSTSFEEGANPLFLLQGANLVQSNGNSPDVRFLPGEAISGDRDDLTSSRRSDNNLNSLIYNYVDEIPSLQIHNVRNFDREERNGRTVAVNSKFICYSNAENALVVKSLKNLSLIHYIKDSSEKIVDIVFLEDTFLNYLAYVYQDGTVIVINIEESQSKDKIIIKYLLRYKLEKGSNKAQIQWKDTKQIGAALENKLKILDVPVLDAAQEAFENTPGPVSQENFDFDQQITDIAFSPSYPLIYVLFEDNLVRIVNLENTSVVKEFAPHDSSEKVVRLLPYKSLIRHEPIKYNAEGDKSYDHTWRDIFLTATQGFEIKVWDLSEWDEAKKSYLCLQTFQLNQNNDKLDPIPLIKRFIFYDAGLNFVFIGFKTNGDKGVCLHTLHIDQFYYGYNDLYDQVKRTKKFFNSIQTIWFRKNDVSDFAVLNFGDDETDFYFKENTYPQMTDTEPASTRTQDGSYACNSKSVISFFVHNDTNISIFKVLGEKLYPLALVEELDKLTQAEQLETPSLSSKTESTDSSYPPDLGMINPFIKDFIDQNLRTFQAMKDQENKNVKLFPEVEKGEALKKSGVSEKKEETISPDPPVKHHRKSKAGNEHKKDKGDQDHEHGKHKGQGQQQQQPMKVVTRENQKNTATQPAMKTLDSIEKDAQIQSIEKGVEKKFQELLDKIPQILTNKINKIEEVIDAKVNERVTKLQSDLITGVLSKEVDEKMQREFSHLFEKTVTPSIEKYFSKVFEQVCASFEKGHKFYIDKLNLEQAKSAQVKETMNEVVKSFVQISNALTEGYANNQSNFSRMETSVQEKQQQLQTLIDQMTEIITKQQELQKQVDAIERNMEEISTSHQSELEIFRETANRYLDRFNEISSGPYGENNKITERIKKETPYQQNYYGMFPGGGGTNPYYNANKGSKDKGPHPLTDQLAYLQAIMSGRPMDHSGGHFNRGPPISLPGMNSPGSSQIFGTNPYAGQNFDYFNNYQKSKSHLPGYGNVNQHQNQHQPIPPSGGNQNPNLPAGLQPPFYNPNQGNQQAQNSNLPPELQLQALYHNLGEFFKNKEKEEEKEKERSFNNTTEATSPFIQNFMGQENAKKFFDMAQVAQGGGGNTSQGSLNSQRTLSQIESQRDIPNTPGQQTSQQDKDNNPKSNTSLPPGIQPQNQNQPNLVQALYQQLPQNLQQQYTQPQNLNTPKISNTYSQNVSPQNSTSNSGNLQGQMPMFNPNLYFQNVPQQNFGGFNNNAGHYGLPPTMSNPQIKVSKNTSNVDISQIPLVNSMFKTPSRDATEEIASNAESSTNN